MQIQLNVDEESIWFTVTILAPHITGRLNFTVDTGSPDTFIGSIDKDRLRIPIKRFYDEDEIHWGETPFKMGRLYDVKLLVVGKEDGKEKIKTFKLEYIGVTQDYIIDTDEKGRPIKISPTLLGLDFIRKQKMILKFDGKNNKAYLENSE